MLVGNVQNSTWRYQDNVLWAWLEIFFFQDREFPILKQNINCHFFGLNSLKGTWTAPIVGVFEADHTKSIKNAF